MTMKRLNEIVPDVVVLLAMEPAELGGAILQTLNSRIDHGDGQDRRNKWHYSGYVSELFLLNREQYPRARQQEIERAVMEGWQWLVNSGLLAQDQDASNFGWRFVTRRGQTLKTSVDIDAFRKASLLPKGMLHPSIADRVWATFIRGEYDTAVFQAFREVEIAVRGAGNFKESDYGKDLMRGAFNKDDGPLRDSFAVVSEQEALSHLFAGAIGYFKNPTSHRAVAYEASAAAEMIILASHLLRIVNAHEALFGPPSKPT